MERFSFAKVVTPIAYFGLIGLIIVFAHSGLQSENGLAAFREAGVEERRLTAELNALAESVRKEWVAKYAKDLDSQALFDFTVALFAK